MIVRLGHERPISRPTVLDPSAVFAAKSLLAPCLVVVTLLLCLLAAHARLGRFSLLLAALTFLAAAALVELKGIATQLLSLRALLDLWLSWLVLLGFLLLAIILSGFGRRLALRPLLVWALVTPWVLWLGQWWVGRKIGWMAQRGAPRAAIIVGHSELGRKLETVLTSNPMLHTRVLGFFEDHREPPATAQPRDGNRILGSLAQLPEFVREHNVQQVYFTLPITRDPQIVALVDGLRDSAASIYFVPDLYAFGLPQAHFDVIGDIPVFAVSETPIIGTKNLAKRLCDLLLSGLALVVLSPVLLAIALGIRLTSPGPVLFRQRRYGLDGAEIRIYKFRSMTVVEDGDRSYCSTLPGDTRVTRLGALLRRCSLDELPQLINVFLGHMSLVGPRPHVVAMNEKYRRLIPHYMVRHKIKPGITGWAQVNGARGGDDLEVMHRRIAYDLDYLRHWSLTLDFKIMLRTLLLVFHDPHAY
jgi:putative colanic acid biosynthesis UDP-glucose lipid carrier transferase